MKRKKAAILARKGKPARPKSKPRAISKPSVKNKPAIKSKPRGKPKAPAPVAHDDAIGAYVGAAARALGLPIDPAWQAAVEFNLRLILRHAALLDEFPLPEDAEPAPIFHA